MKKPTRPYGPTIDPAEVMLWFKQQPALPACIGFRWVVISLMPLRVELQKCK